MTKPPGFGILLCLAVACNPAATPTPDEGVPRRQPGPMTMQPLDSTLHSYYRYSSGYPDSARLIVRDNSAWSTLWTRIVSNHGPTPATPAIDFANEMVIAVAMGTRSSGGYTIRIAAVEQRTDDIAVTVVSTSPGRSCGTTAALTAPMDIVRVPRSDLPVRFIEQATVHDCG